jgi:hypothetical protein
MRRGAKISLISSRAVGNALASPGGGQPAGDLMNRSAVRGDERRSSNESPGAWPGRTRAGPGPVGACGGRARPRRRGRRAERVGPRASCGSPGRGVGAGRGRPRRRGRAPWQGGRRSTSPRAPDLSSGADRGSARAPGLLEARGAGVRRCSRYELYGVCKCGYEGCGRARWRRNFDAGSVPGVSGGALTAARGAGAVSGDGARGVAPNVSIWSACGGRGRVKCSGVISFRLGCSVARRGAGEGRGRLAAVGSLVRRGARARARPVWKKKWRRGRGAWGPG